VEAVKTELSGVLKRETEAIQKISTLEVDLVATQDLKTSLESQFSLLKGQLAEEEEKSLKVCCFIKFFHVFQRILILILGVDCCRT
jgi:hypothetical protein